MRCSKSTDFIQCGFMRLATLLTLAGALVTFLTGKNCLIPRHLKAAANILKKVSTEGGSVKSLLYDKKHRHYNTNVLFALINETIKHSALLEKIFESSQLYVNEPRLEPWLAKILTTELLFGKKTLPGNSKPIQTILSYKDQFEKYVSEHQDDNSIIEVVLKPRYVRVNTNLLTTSDAIRYFQDEGYRFVRCTSTSYNDYLNQVKNLTDEDFMQDFHVKTMLVFSPGAKFHDHELYLENKILLQDKATSLAVHLLAPAPGSVVLDMCAAPGMKTTQLAAYMKNEGKIYAVEQNEKRYATLCEFVENTGCKSVQTIHKDVLEIRRGELEDVEYILLDPSCSGSGMEISVHKYIDANRLAKLTSLQEKFLKHAMNAFPKAKRIIYSTCSLHPEENERVVTNIVKTSRVKWRVQDVSELLKGQWNNFGSNMYGSIGTRCLYAKPDLDLTRGFFLAVIDRDFGDAEAKVKDGEDSGLIKPKKGFKRDPISEPDDTHVENCEGNTLTSEKKSKKNKNAHNDDVASEGKNVVDTESIEGAAETNRKRKKKSKTSVNNINSDNLPLEDANITNEDNEHTNDRKDLTPAVNLEISSVDINLKEKMKKKLKYEKESETRIDTQNVSFDTNDHERVKRKKCKRKKSESHQECNEVLAAEVESIKSEPSSVINEESAKKKKKKRAVELNSQ